MENKRQIGSNYEQKAMQYLQDCGYHILEKNYRNRCGEIDIIATKGGDLIFVEVKYRKTSAAGFSLEAIDQRKTARIRRTAQVYLWKHRYPETQPCRFDAVGIDGDRILHMRNAF